MADSQIGSGFGITALPHLREFAITGPIKVTGISDSPSRRRIFTLPADAAVRRGRLRRQHRQASRRRWPTVVRSSADDVQKLMVFYEQGRQQGDFEEGVRMALQALLASPKFLFRLEEVPATVRPGQNYRITDYDLASRLSFFLWGSGPGRGTAEGWRARARCGSRWCSRSRCSGCWPTRAPRRSPPASPRSGCACRTWSSSLPDYLHYPQYDRTLADALKRETELLFDAIVRDDRPLLELLTADYTFVNERVARHYGMPNVTGPEFRRVALTDPNRRGLLGQGSILALTSVADRTSPVQRGKWIMEVLLGSPPPAPPPNVPSLDDSVGAAQGAKLLSVRAAHGRAPQEPGVHVVPPRDRSAGPGARELRRHRRLAHPRRRRHDRLQRRPLRRHEDGRPAGTARRAAEALGRRSCSASPRA